MAGVEYPVNDFTRMIESVSRANASGMRAPVVADGEPAPSVRTPAMRRPVPVIEEPLSAQEHAELNRLAIEAGVQDPRLGNVNEGPTGGMGGDASQDKYANMSMEEILAEGASVHQPAAAPSAAPGNPVMTRQNRNGLIGASRQTAREFIGRTEPAPVVIQQPRLPNFKNVQGIDLITGDVFVDDMAFKIPVQDLSEFRRYAVEVARASIMKQLDEALSLVSQDEPAEEGVDQAGTTGEAEGIQRIGEGDRAESTG
jgi:hypothetical protein